MSSTPVEPSDQAAGSTIEVPRPPAPPPDRTEYAESEKRPKRVRFSQATDALRAVYVGLGSLVVLDGASIGVFHNSGSTAAAVIGAVSAPIATLVGAYFGMRTGTDAGAAGKTELEQRRSDAETRSLALAGQMDPRAARDALHALGIPVPGSQGDVMPAATAVPQG